MTSVATLTEPPTDVRYFPENDDPAANMQPEHMQRLIEIFDTPLQGAYNWDYEAANHRLRRLYQLGKELNWNAETDLDWNRNFPKGQFPIDQSFNPMVGYEPYERMSDAGKLEFAWHDHAWTVSQFLHGEQGALLVASQLVSCAPTYDAKLYASSQTFDEARHVEVFGRYLREKVGIMYPVNPNLKFLLDKIMADPRWDLKFIGMQIIIEGLALAAFNTLKQITNDELFRDIVSFVIRDEGRHVAFGVNFLEDYVKALSQEEREARAEFAYEAAVVMRERLIATEVFQHFGWDSEEARKRVLEADVMEKFRNLLFTRIMPNLKRIGLLTDNVRPLYDKLGVLGYENLVDDGEIDWAQLEQPLY